MTPLAEVRSLGLSSHAPLPSATATLSGVDVAFGATPVLRQLNWQLLPGQVVGLLGRNGAGKTTLLETLLGLREPDHGEVRLLGQAAAALDDAARARIGYVPQHSNLFEWLTPRQLLDYFRSFYPRWNTAKVDALMAAWDLRRDLPIAKLSGGQQQRLSIVRALAHDPDLLVLDEPVASLDPVGRRDFLRELVERVIDRGTTVVFSTHILSDLERVAFNFAFLAHGHIVLQAPLDELKETCRIAAPDPALLRLPGVQRLGSTSAAAPRWLLRGGPGTAWPAGCVAPSLEDLFGELTA